MLVRRLEQVDAHIRLLMRAGFTQDRAMDGYDGSIPTQAVLTTMDVLRTVVVP